MGSRLRIAWRRERLDRRECTHAKRREERKRGWASTGTFAMERGNVHLVRERGEVPTERKMLRFDVLRTGAAKDAKDVGLNPSISTVSDASTAVIHSFAHGIRGRKSLKAKRYSAKKGIANSKMGTI